MAALDATAIDPPIDDAERTDEAPMALPRAVAR
jgi:hypothetical protein